MKHPVYSKAEDAPVMYTFKDLAELKDGTSLVLPKLEKKINAPASEGRDPFDIKITVEGMDTFMDIRDVGAIVTALLSKDSSVEGLTAAIYSDWIDKMNEIRRDEKSIANSIEFLSSAETELRKLSGATLSGPVDITDPANYPLLIWALAVSVPNAEAEVSPALLPPLPAPAAAGTAAAGGTAVTGGPV